MAVLLTNSTANGGVGGQVDGVDPLRNPGKYRAAWVSKHYGGAFIHELGHLFGAREKFYYHILYHLSKLEKSPCISSVNYFFATYCDSRFHYKA